MTITSTITGSLDTVEEISAADSPASGGAGNRRSFNQYNSNNVQLTGTSTPAVSKVVDLSHTLSGGTTKDWDLTAAPAARNINETEDLTGLRLVGIKINNTSDSNWTIEPHPTTNGYNLFGNASGQVTLLPGARIQQWLEGVAANLPAVAAGEKVIRLTGVDTKAIEIIAVFG